MFGRVHGGSGLRVSTQGDRLQLCVTERIQYARSGGILAEGVAQFTDGWDSRYANG